MARLEMRLVGLTMVAVAMSPVAETRQGDPVAWDARVELVSVMFHLAGAPEYSTNKVPRYSAAVASYFANAKEHPAIAATREMREKHRIAFFHPMNFAVHLTEPPALTERAPFDQPGLAIGARWLAAPYRPYLEQVRAFYREARVADFFKAQAPLYEIATARLSKVVASEIDEAWFRAYFGSGPATRFKAVPSMLNGGAQYGATYRVPGVDEAYAVMGVFKIDTEGLPVFDRDDADNVVHEYAHTLTNVHVDAVISKLETSGPALFEKVRDQMRNQSYGQWQTMVYEQVVRAVVVRFITARRGDADGRKEIDAQEKLGFMLTGPIAAVLADYERNRSTYPAFADVMPRIVAVFEGTK